MGQNVDVLRELIAFVGRNGCILNVVYRLYVRFIEYIGELFHYFLIFFHMLPAEPDCGAAALFLSS
jgi:hypothetical protein